MNSQNFCRELVGLTWSRKTFLTKQLQKIFHFLTKLILKVKLKFCTSNWNFLTLHSCLEFQRLNKICEWNIFFFVFEITLEYLERIEPRNDILFLVFFLVFYHCIITAILIVISCFLLILIFHEKIQYFCTISCKILLIKFSDAM